MMGSLMVREDGPAGYAIRRIGFSIQQERSFSNVR
jgi:hypothetical protein